MKNCFGTILALGYGQPPGGYVAPPPAPPAYAPAPQMYQPPASPAPRPGRLGTVVMAVGVVLLIIGAILMVVGLAPGLGLSSKKAADLKYTVGTSGGTFDDLKAGDTFTLTGKITNETSDINMSMVYGGKYAYQLDDQDFTLVSEDDLGNIGDTISVPCKVEEKSFSFFGMSFKIQYLKANAGADTAMMIAVVGIVLLIVGILLMVVGIRMRKKATAAVQPGYQQPAGGAYPPQPGQPAYQPTPQPGYAPPPYPPQQPQAYQPPAQPPYPPQYPQQ